MCCFALQSVDIMAVHTVETAVLVLVEVQCIAVYCSVLQCVAVCCSVLFCIAKCRHHGCSHDRDSRLGAPRGAVYCSVCRVLQCVAVCSSAF